MQRGTGVYTPLSKRLRKDTDAYVEVLVANIPSDDDGGILSIICLGTAKGGPKSCLAIEKAFETWEPLYARYAYVEVLVANTPSDDDGGILFYVDIAVAKWWSRDDGAIMTIVLWGTAKGGPKSCLAIAKAFERDVRAAVCGEIRLRR